MAEYVRALSVQDLAEGRGREIDVAGRAVAVFNVGGEFFALDARCPHRGGPLAAGYIDGFTLTCPWHDWTFDLRNGRGVAGVEAEVGSFETMVDNSDVLVRVR
jgi:nitrite reductase (NADH) small subunit